MTITPGRVRANDATIAEYIRTHLPPGWSYEHVVQFVNLFDHLGYSTGGNTRNVHFGGGGEVLTDMAAAATLLRASPASAKKMDLTNFTECRIVCVMGGVAAPAGGKCIAKFKTTLGANDAAYAALGTSAVEAAMDTADTATASAWIPLAAAAKADVFVAVSTSGGDGAVDPVLGNLEVQFR